jgi:hypothetical protein
VVDSESASGRPAISAIVARDQLLDPGGHI